MLTKTHQKFLDDHAVDLRVAREIGVRSIDAGLVFPWVDIDGRTIEQFRPDVVEEGEPKYLWPAGEPPLINVHPGMRTAVLDHSNELVLVEGTKQYLAAVSAMPDRAIAGLVGCYGWSSDGAPVPGLAPLVTGRRVLICFDADVGSNRDVYEAAERIAGMIVAFGGTIGHVVTPGGGTTGLDDILAQVERRERKNVLDRILSTASPKLPRKPAKKKSNRFPEDRYFDDEGLLLGMLADDAIDQLHVRSTRERLALYDTASGCYRLDPTGVEPAVRLLNNRYKQSYGVALRDHLIVRCRATGREMPEHTSDPVINIPNGLLDLVTLKLHQHTPEYLSTVQMPVEWSSTATCPTYDRWIREMVGTQVDDLEEVTGTMFDRTHTPTKAILAWGPSRSGKSTFLRLIEAIAGAENTSAVTLHNIAGDDRFAMANLYGKIANVAADLSARELRDLSAFKMLTGEDTVHGNRKYGSQFGFNSRALLAFSANTIPTVSEASTAYLERIKPFHFANSFAGHEDRSIEMEMMDELPGIQRRWIDGLRRLWARGGYGPSDPTVAEEFAVQSDRVRQWVTEETVNLDASLPRARWTPGPVLFVAFDLWTRANASPAMGRNTFYQRLESAGVFKGRTDRAKTAFDIALAPYSSDPSRQPYVRAGDEVGGVSPREGGVEKKGQTVSSLIFDLETCDAAELWRRSDFIRIAGRLNGDGHPVVDADPTEIVRQATAGAQLVAHNGFAFDFVAMARHHGLDLLALGENGQLLDTRVLAVLADPPESRMNEQQIAARYELDSVANRLGHEGKINDIRRLARRHGGFDKIPLDDAEYLAYCAGDVAATAHIASSYEMTDYDRREMRLLGRLVSSITVGGFRVDEALLSQRLSEQEGRLAERQAWLIAEYGLPTVKADGKPAVAPHRTNEGMAAIDKAFLDHGVDLPRTKSGRPQLDQATMDIVLREVADDPVVVELAQVVRAMNGEPAVYGSVAQHLVDGRIHPVIDARQASGRLSIRKPGLTIFGKRSDVLVAQRDVLIADEGCQLLAIDLSQIDARAIAALSGDEAYASVFADGRDIHLENAMTFWGDASYRSAAKVISHGWNYGMGIERLARTARVSMQTAIEFDAGMRATYPRLVEWTKEIAERAARGELLDNGFGRMMRPTPSRAHTQGPALEGQGCARDLMMEGVMRLPVEVVPMLRAIVHDELVFSIPTDRVDEVRSLALQALSFEWGPSDGSGLVVSVVADVSSPGHCWGALYR